ncbi:MAG: HAD family hydrolase [Candidatus Hatepunaea meridiana]|nr:HAD family hydrolase [Candidatus Hatepunaea meridiana]
MTEQIKAISFDGDGTLWDFNKVMEHSLKIVLDDMYLKYGDELPEQVDVPFMISVRNEVAEKHKGKITNLEEVRRLAFVETLSRIGIPDDRYADYLNQLYLKHRFEDVELYADVMPAMEAIQENYLIALISNGNGYPDRCGLSDIFDVVAFSQDYGFEKPDERLFRDAFNRLNCFPEQVMHIGDSCENDYIGANKAGAVGIWLNRDNKPVPDGCTKWISNLRDCFKYLT